MLEISATMNDAKEKSPMCPRAYDMYMYPKLRVLLAGVFFHADTGVSRPLRLCLCQYSSSSCNVSIIAVVVHKRWGNELQQTSLRGTGGRRDSRGCMFPLVLHARGGTPVRSCLGCRVPSIDRRFSRFFPGQWPSFLPVSLFPQVTGLT